MKIGILTFHCAHNYGAVLQCYAMQEFLRSKGHDVEVINYRPNYLLEPYKIFNIKRFLTKNPIRLLKSLIIEFILFPVRLNRFYGFEKFINGRLNLSKKVTSSSISPNYDIFIVGSDQVWNPKITQGFDSVFFADFPFLKGEKKYISYAASMEAKALNDDQTAFFKKNLNNFDSMSVREDALQQLLQPLIGKPIYQVLDPVLMVPSQIWGRFLPKHENKVKYVLVYQVCGHKNTRQIAQHIAKQIGAKVKVLVAAPQINIKNTFQTATPIDFVNTFRFAECVVTTSFHGTAFSIIFNRPFYSIKLNVGTDSRSSSLLKSVGLEQRMIDVNDLPVFSQIDYSEVNQKLDVLRVKSQDYLLGSLQI